MMQVLKVLNRHEMYIHVNNCFLRTYYFCKIQYLANITLTVNWKKLHGRPFSEYIKI